ncbi:MAG: M6 family metalloprotease domain-containing protein [Bacteroidales bacterium]|jgi:M6 family metalloprotease-like protein|nr:M6 family metalloprotease domain-containing protein [Bacteroidales bacterium]
MKIKILLFVIFVLNVFNASAAYFSYLPYQVTQPNGVLIDCFVSGDEYFNWLHDKNGYTIIQADDGYFYYGETAGDIVKPTKYRVGEADPTSAGLTKWAKISLKEYRRHRDFYTENVDRSVMAPHTGTMNNLVVYIRFNDDTEFSTPRQTFDNLFNPPSGTTLKSYYLDVSYNTFTISSTHYPACDLTINLSYRDSHNRNYFQPYNAVTNPDGYRNDNQRKLREHTLLRDAVVWINVNSPVPGDLNLDGDNDGKVDNVCFVIRGGNGAWAELLWAHRWALTSFDVYINGKMVYDYTFQPETQVAVNTLCHEMFHALGAPDLYHYTDNGIAPVGPWDLMESGIGHMGAYMKWKYTNHAWINSIPEITTSGTYSMHPLASASNNCYKIASPYTQSQYFIVEYRKKEGTFEGTLPGSGLLVYRIDTTEVGNADGPPDEVYIYRPGGTLSTNGSPNIANYSSGSGRTAMNETTDPTSFLQDGSPGGLFFMNVTSADTTISFTVNVTHIKDPGNFTASPMSTSQIRLTWLNHPDVDHIVIAYDTAGIFGTPLNGTPYLPGDTLTGGGIIIYSGTDTLFNHMDLAMNTHYYYKTWSVITGDVYSFGVASDASTFCQSITVLPFNEGFETNIELPVCWTEENNGLSWLFCQGNGPGIGYGFPADAHTGIRNAVLKDETTAPNRNKLILPVLNLSNYSNVELRFWLFMQRWGTRQDELTVFYRTNPANSWISLQNYAQSITAWTEKIIQLPVVSSQFQLAFEGNAKFGFGVCIDDILINGTIVGVNEPISDAIRIFPNPTHGIFRITGDRNDNLIREITVFDCAGKRMAGIYGKGEKDFTFDLSSAASGIYILKSKRIRTY